jgi:hypothetical protein
MTATSSDSLELRALMQRERIHRTAVELMGKVDEAKEQLSLQHNVRAHFGIASLIAGTITFLSGYAIGSALKGR